MTMYCGLTDDLLSSLISRQPCLLSRHMMCLALRVFQHARGTAAAGSTYSLCWHCVFPLYAITWQCHHSNVGCQPGRLPRLLRECYPGDAVPVVQQTYRGISDFAAMHPTKMCPLRFSCMSCRAKPSPPGSDLHLVLVVDRARAAISPQQDAWLQQLVAQWLHRVRLRFNQHNLGASATRNRALEVRAPTTMCCTALHCTVLCCTADTCAMWQASSFCDNLSWHA